MATRTTSGAAVPGHQAPEWPNKDDARELGGGAGIMGQAKTISGDCRVNATALQRLEAESGTETIKPTPSHHDEVYAAAWRYWLARDALLALDPVPLSLDASHRSRRQRLEADAGIDPSRPYGVFPIRRDTVIAEALAHMLQGKRLTGMDAVFKCNTTRLADYVYRLRRQYGWCVESRAVEVQTKDGRTARVSEYWLSPGVADAAMAAAGVDFCSEVHVARGGLRAGAQGPSREALTVAALRVSR